MRTFSYLIFLVFQISVVEAQYPFLCEDKNYNEQIQTVLINPTDVDLSYPIIQLGDSDLLFLSFDVLGDFAYTYHYTFIHCTYDWKPSQLHPREYLMGYDDGQISDYRFSLNTITSYVHHTLTFPNSEIQPKLSGNYLFVVYKDDLKEGNIQFTRRFMVVDLKAKINATIPQHPRKNEYYKTKQQVDVEVITVNSLANKPSNTFNLVIRQNSRWDNAIVGVKPNYVFNDKLTFDYDDKTIFESGNVWRNIDLKSFEYQSENIENISKDIYSYKVKLWNDQRRNRKVYQSGEDIFGRRFIQGKQDQDTDIEGDYAWVNFFLPYDAPLGNEELYVIGALNDGNLNEKNKMIYNFSDKGYGLSMFLKQGYYNYLYGVKEKDNSFAEVETIEGSHWDTQNEYLILLYYRKEGTSYDQLVSTAIILSH